MENCTRKTKSCVHEERPREEQEMNWLTRIYVKAAEWHKGQTMTEYALILSAVAVVVFIGYQTMGTDISALLNAIDSQL
jgi:Flp pilus assembly pilin Flp